ncbi:hypothetical protein [Roseospira navarrensis]|uniref:Nodulation protein Z (NodZ) n=1 Tax=Roseospira navarrensis TaxID=140058 RepID=A0A7X1ZF16_9PROT|nr:hypothetical protein [Roseospira navarrensis]MQX37098.1 hypothetical protein [Roseospira navarrensis]
MSRYVLIKGKGGFGNRILSAATGIVYAELTDRQPVIDWRDNTYDSTGMNVYKTLFDSPEMPDPESLNDEQSVAPALWRGRLGMNPSELISQFDPKKHSDPFIYRKYCVDLSRLDRETTVVVFWSYLPKLARLNRALRADPRFRGRSHVAINRDVLETWFRPNARIRAKVDALASADRRPLIGVHIRYTDRKTPLGAFERALTTALAKQPDAAIFLATDSGEVERRIRDRFPGVFTLAKWLPEDGGRLHNNANIPDATLEAENALADMWTLGQCDQLLYSSRSTFSVVSAILGSARGQRALDVERANPLLRAKQAFQRYA